MILLLIGLLLGAVIVLSVQRFIWAWRRIDEIRAEQRLSSKQSHQTLAALWEKSINEDLIQIAQQKSKRTEIAEEKGE